MGRRELISRPLHPQKTARSRVISLSAKTHRAQLESTGAEKSLRQDWLPWLPGEGTLVKGPAKPQVHEGLHSLLYLWAGGQRGREMGGKREEIEVLGKREGLQRAVMISWEDHSRESQFPEGTM